MKLTRSGFRSEHPKKKIERLKRQYKESHYLLFKEFMEPDFLLSIENCLKRASFSPRKLEVVSESVTRDLLVFHLLDFVFNDAMLFQSIEELTGCGPIGSFAGRIYRMAPGKKHYLDWHTDDVEHRLAALTVNLTQRPYQGGVLRMRLAKESGTEWDVPSPRYGDAVLFRVAPYLEHRVTEVRGLVPRTVVTGWFVSKPRRRRMAAELKDMFYRTTSGKKPDVVR